MSNPILTAFLGRLPTPEDRAIYADQTERLVAIRTNPLLPTTTGLQDLPPFAPEVP